MFVSIHRFAVAASAITAAFTLTVSAAHAQTTFFQSSFEASEGYNTTVNKPVTTQNPTQTFTPAPGNLYSQLKAGAVFSFGTQNLTDPALSVRQAVNSTTVVNTTAASGTQSVEINGSVLGNEGTQTSVARDLVAGIGGVLTVSSDIKVTNPSASYGQWGVFMSNFDGTNINTEAAFGFVAGSVLGSPDGTNLYAAFNLSTGAAYQASYNTFNNYAVQMNFASRTISGYFNGTQVGFVPINAAGTPIGAPGLTMPFAATTGNLVTDVAIGQAISGTNENGFFDNVRVSGVNEAVAPEPISLTLLGAGLLGAFGYRSRRTNRSRRTGLRA